MHKLLRWSIVGLFVLIPKLGSVFAEDSHLFATEIAAREHCPADIVVWVDTARGIYHFKGMRWYGNTTNGAYACRKEGDQSGYRLPVFCRYCSGTGLDAVSLTPQ